MDKYEYSIKADKIKKLVDHKDYATAVKIADTIDWERVKNSKMLSTVSLAYEKMDRYEDAKDILLLAYESAPVGRRFLYRLTELAVKEGKLEEAETYLKEFAAISPKDPSRLILRYEIAEAGNEPLERLITILEAYQKREFEERWSYELASLYYRADKTEECVKLCDEIILWFGVGPYVDKALELKQKIQPLTPEQLERKEHKEKYLRQLEDVQKEFEEEEKSRTGMTKKPQAPRAEKPGSKAERKAAYGAEPETAPDAVYGTEAETVPGAAYGTEPETVREMAYGTDPEAVPVAAPGTVLGIGEADPEEQALQEEIATSLAKEIETAAMTATLNEMMLRETAATMEEVGAVNNDHSDQKERTKIASDRFVERTQEFAREAFVINEVLKEVTGEAVSPEVIEEKLKKLAVREAWGGVTEKEMAASASSTPETVAPESPAQEPYTPEAEEGLRQETLLEESSAEEEPAIEEPAVEESAGTEPAAEEPAEEEEPAAEESVAEEPAEEESTAEEPAETESTVEEPAAETEPATEEPVTESPAEEVPAEEPIAEKPAAEVPAIETPVAEEPVTEEPATESSPQETAGGTNTIVRDHYILAASEDERTGLQRSVEYIRDTRLSMGKPATQIAKITGQKLATKEITRTMRKLQGRDLVITGITDLPDEVLLETIQWMAEDQVESFIVLLDTERELERLIARKPYFENCVYLAEKPEPACEEPNADYSEDTEQGEQTERSAQTAQKESGAEASEAEASETEETEGHTLAELVEAALKNGGLEAYQAVDKYISDTETDFGQGKSEEEPPTSEQEEPPAPEQESEPARRQTGTVSMTGLGGGMQPRQFVDTAIQYARMLDTIIDEMGELALFALAEDYQQEREPLTEELAQEVVEKAILRAEKRSLRSLFSNRYDKDGYLILKEKHFKEDR